MAERTVVITGMGAVTPFGVGVQRYGEEISQGRSAARPITSFDVSQLPTRFAAQAPPDNELDPLVHHQKSLKTMCRASKLAMLGAQEAVDDAGLDLNRVNPYRVGTCLGAGGLGPVDLEYSTQSFEIVNAAIRNGNSPRLDPGELWRQTLEAIHPLAPLRVLPNMAAAHIAIKYNARGPCQTLATACTSGTQAIGEASRLIRLGAADIIIAGGSDSMINPNGLVAFSALGVLSKNNAQYQQAARPFDRRRDGFMLGEGAALFVLEALEHCQRRGGRPYAEIAGYASTCDAFRLTDEPAEAWGSIAAMKAALDDARLNPEAVDYINAHGTGTPMNDKTETFAIKSVFGERAKSVPVSSTKSIIGHLVAASGAAELLACVLALQQGVIPPTINYEQPDPECDLDYVPNTARQARLRVVLKNSFGFGGQNACLILRKI